MLYLTRGSCTVITDGLGFGSQSGPRYSEGLFSEASILFRSIPSRCTLSTGKEKGEGEERGRRYMERINPTLCHGPDTYTSEHGVKYRFQGIKRQFGNTEALRRENRTHESASGAAWSQRCEPALPARAEGSGWAGALGSLGLSPRGMERWRLGSSGWFAPTKLRERRGGGTTKIQRCRNPPWPSSESPRFHLLK